MANRKTIRTTEFQALLDRYLAGKCTDEEKALLETWYLDYEAKGLSALTSAQLEEIRLSTAPLRKTTRIWAFRRWVAAAAAAAILFTAGYFIFASRETDLASRLAASEILPGGNRATLMLADGTSIDLDEAQNGIVIGHENITYTDGSVLDASVTEAESRRDVSQLKLTTPKGGTYQVTLPDGSKVWLNANSTLEYPSRFSGDVREVFLEGEAYFDIKVIQGTRDTRAPASGPDFARVPASSTNPDDAHVPFNVQTSGQTVQVLGTEFNVSAYTDEPGTKTTLVEGAVEIVNLQSNTVNRIKPGEQSIVRESATTIQQVDTKPYTAWKDGYFFFDRAPLSAVMRQLAQWYDVEVIFTDSVEDERFHGLIGRNKDLGQVLKILENTKVVHFTVKGKTVYINKR